MGVFTRVFMKFTNFVYGRYSLIQIVILDENNLKRNVFCEGLSLSTIVRP